MNGEVSGNSSQTPGWQFKPGQEVGPEGAQNQQPPAPLVQDDWSGQQPQNAEIPSVHPDYVDVERKVSWSASEFIAHHKSAGWYLALVGAALGFASIIYVLTRDKISTGIVLFVAAILGISAARKPRTLAYQVDDEGIHIAEKFYDYGQFRSFAIVADGAFGSIVFMPLKRFMPSITIYYDPKDENAIGSILSDHLPFEEHKLDLLDQFVRRIRF